MPWRSPVTADMVLDPCNIQAAISRVRRNNGAPGIDGITVDKLRLEWIRRRSTTVESIRTRCYQPSPVKRVMIPKPNGEWRRLGIPSVLDRMLQVALNRQLKQVVETMFSPASFGFRPGRNCLGAVKFACTHVEAGFPIVHSLDIKDCFGSLQHDIVLDRFRPFLDDLLMDLVHQWLRNNLSIGGEEWPTTEGVSQGGPLSPMACNLVLHTLDQTLTAKSTPFFRYADDVKIFVRDEPEAMEIQSFCQRFLHEQLKLNVKGDKDHIQAFDSCDLLGYGLTNDLKIGIATQRVPGIKMWLSAKVWQQRLRPKDIVSSINKSIDGWNRYYDNVYVPRPISTELNDFLLTNLKERFPHWFRRQTSKQGFPIYKEGSWSDCLDTDLVGISINLERTLSACGLVAFGAHTRTSRKILSASPSR